jgi:bifunctional non-homologous end joining protein LigD
MLPSAVPGPPAGERWVHESKLDGFRCLAQVSPCRVRLWSRTGTEWVDRLPELDRLTAVGEVVLDGEVVVVTADGRADFELLAARVHGRRQAPDSHPVTFFVFDVLRVGDDEVCDQPWSARRQILDDLDLADSSGGAAQPTIWSDDGAAMHQATRAVRAEGTVSKRADSGYRAGRSRRWVKAKHQAVETFQVAGWRPSRPARPGGLLIAEAGQPIGLATLALPEDQRAALVELLRRYGRSHPTGTITIAADCIQAVVRYTSRTPTHGHLREAVVVAIEPGRSGDSHSALPSSHDRTGVR